MRDRLRVQLNRNISSLGVDLSIGYKDTANQQIMVCKKFTYVEASPHSMVLPCETLEEEDCISLMDELWRIGVRPSRIAEPSESNIKFLQDHIDDLRNIAFNALDIEKKRS